MACVANPYALKPLTLLEILTAEGLTSGLLFALDAGDAASYTSGQVWTDVSGSGNHFNRGDTNGAEATDPTFNGTAGGVSELEYFSTDGGDFFNLAAGTFDDAWSNDNGAFTVGAVFMPSTNAPPLIGNYRNGFNGIFLRASMANGSLSALYHTADGVQVTQSAPAGEVVAGVANLALFGIDDATTTGKLKANRAAITSFVKAASTATASPNGLALLGYAAGGAGGVADTGTRLYAAFAWNRLLTDVEMTSFALALASRFPSMP